MITINDGPDAYSRGTVAQDYVNDGFDVTVYPVADECPQEVTKIPPFAVAASEEETVVVYILTRNELVDNDELMSVVETAESRTGIRVDIQFVTPGDEQVSTLEVARVANPTLRSARRLFMQGDTRRSFYLLAQAITHRLQSHIAEDDCEGVESWSRLLEQLQFLETENMQALMLAVIAAPVSKDEGLEVLESHFDRLESLYARLLRYENEPSAEAFRDAVTP